jgi:hypothetical protein
MRLRISNSVLLFVAVAAIASRPYSAADGAEPPKSTIRIVAAASPQEAIPQQIVLPSQPAAPIAEPRVERPEVVPAPAAPPERNVPPAAQYPVERAIHTAPVAAPSSVVVANAGEPSVTGPNFAAPNAVRTTAVAAPKQAPTSGRTPPVVKIYSSPSAQATLSRMPRRMTVQPRPNAQSTNSRGKPFQSIPTEPAVSAYMNMYRREADSNGVPNYFAFVLPQLEQQQANRQQASELQKLRGQVQALSSAGGAANSPNMTAHARYMDTAQYYSGMKR